MAIMAWFVALALKALVAVLVDLTRGYLGLFIRPPAPGYTINASLLLFLLVIVVVIYTVTRMIVDSRIGLAFRAIGQDFDYARAS